MFGAHRDIWTARKGFLPNALATVVAQVASVLIALGLERLRFPEPAIVIVFVLGVLVTAIFTDGLGYSIAASALAVLSFNYFLVEPRLSLRTWRHDYPQTFMVIFVVALIASYLVSELRKNAHQRTEARMLAEREQMRADLLRSVSHDLRTPLTSISGNAEILLEGGDSLPGPTRDRLAHAIREDASWLTSVVENLLAITRLEDKSVQLNWGLEALDEVVEEALRHVHDDGGGHTIVVEPSDEQVFARMDAALVVQLVVNLVNNALIHTPAGTTVTITCARRDGMAELTVADDGPGITDDDKGRIFEPFYTERGLAADGRRGIGLGLPLCQTIARAHGGTLAVRDVEPRGVAFAFALPLEEVLADE